MAGNRAQSKTQTLFAGSLADVSIGDLFQTLEMSGKPSRVEFETDVGAGTVWFREREVVAALCAGQTGADAIYRLAMADEGSFIASFKEELELPHRLQLSPQRLLMEAARRRDEWLERAGDGLRPATCVAVADASGAALDADAQALLERIGAGAQLLDAIPPTGEEDVAARFTTLRALLADGVVVERSVLESTPASASTTSAPSIVISEVSAPAVLVPPVEDFWVRAVAVYVLGNTPGRAVARLLAVGVMLLAVVLGLVWGSARVLLGGLLLGWALLLLGHAAADLPQLPLRRPLLLLGEPLVTIADLLARLGVKLDVVDRGRALARRHAAP